jgi:hypothetical protein
MNLSWIALVLGILATFPQLYQILTTGSVRDYHPWTPALAIGANCVLAAHARQTRDTGLFAFAVWFMVYNAVILWYKKQED